MENQFAGFSRDFADFLFTLRFRNTMELLPENKVAYKNFITEPLTSLFHGLTPTALEISETLVTRSAKCVCTPYADMRFSKATPLKEYMYIRFREPFSSKDALGLYFDMGCDGYSYGIRIYKQTSGGMDQIRNGILANKKAFAKELTNLSDMGMTIVGDKFAKDHFADEDTLLKQLLNRKNFYITRNCPIGESVFGDGLLSEISDAFAGLKGMYALLKNSLY